MVSDKLPDAFIGAREAYYRQLRECERSRAIEDANMMGIEDRYCCAQAEHANERCEAAEARVSALEKENGVLRVAAGVAEGETVVSSEHGSVLVDGSGGSRKRVSPVSEREIELAAENATVRIRCELLEKALAELLDAYTISCAWEEIKPAWDNAERLLGRSTEEGK